MTSEWPKPGEPGYKAPKESVKRVRDEESAASSEHATSSSDHPNNETDTDINEEKKSKAKMKKAKTGLKKKKKDKNAPTAAKVIRVTSPLHRTLVLATRHFPLNLTHIICDCQSAYIFFSIEKRAELTKDCPGRTFAEYAAGVSALWKKIDGKPDKKKYEDLAAADKVRYNKELNVYNDMLAEMDDEERAEYDIENNPGRSSSEVCDSEENDGDSKKEKKRKKKHKKDKKEKKDKKKHGATTDDADKKHLSKPSIGGDKKKVKKTSVARSKDIDEHEEVEEKEEEEEEEAEHYGSSEDEKEPDVFAQDSLPPSTQYNSEDEEMHAAKLMKEEEEEEEDEEACMTLAVSPSISPSKKIDQHVISKSSNEDIAASTTPEKDSNDKFVFSKPALPSKPPKHAKHEESHKVKSCEKLARKEFLTPSIGSSGVVKPKKNGFSVPKKMH